MLQILPRPRPFSIGILPCRLRVDSIKMTLERYILEAV